MVCITGLEHHVSQLADLCPPASSLLHLDVAPVQEVLPPVFPRHCLLWWGPPHHSVCVRHESQGTPRGKQRDPTGGNRTQEIPVPLSSVGPTSTFCLFCHTDEKDSFLGHLSHSGDLLLWVGVRRRASCVVRRATCVVRRPLTSSS